MLGFLHKKTTRRILGEFGFSESAQTLVVSSCVWPDAVRYFDDRYHAQTPLRSDGRPQPADEAALRFSLLLSVLINKIQSDEPAERLVWLGCCLHLVQDLAVHQGNTGPEHFWQLFWLWKFPDIAPADVRRARDFSRQFLSAIRMKFGEAFWHDLKTTPIPALTPNQLRQRLLGKSDFSWRSVFQFVRSVWQYLWWPRSAKRTRWDIAAVLRQALQ
ncbi:MAG: hypothetical protein WC497_02935 [Patescibacteria group bacterium]